MAIGGAEQAAIIELMNGKYMQILGIEQPWGIRFEEGDMRERIEHFHDAVRALTSGEADIYEKHSRLAVEQLAYDLAMLRQIQDRPVGSINRATEKSTGTELVRKDQAGAGIPKLPPAGTRAELAALYVAYTVFFAALFAEVADKNFKTRVGDIDASVSDLGLVEEVLNALIAGTMSTEQAMNELMHVERDDLRERIQTMLASSKVSVKEKQEALALLKQIEKGLAKEKNALEKASLSYATGQLAVFEQSKDVVKGLAAQGLNLAGRFLENSMRAAGQGYSRGV